MAKKAVTEDKKRSTTVKQDENAKTPKSALTNGEKDGRDVRAPQVAEPETRSFDERTGVAQPFLRADGSQDNGARDLSKPEGARRESNRDGNKTTVEETDKAIEEGIVEGGKQVVPGDETELEPAKNPVK